MSGEDEANGLWIALHHFRQKLGAVHARHAHVRNNDIKGVLPHQLQGFAAAFCKYHLPFRAQMAQHALQTFQDEGLIIDKEDTSLCIHGAPVSSSAPASCHCGRKILKAVPSPSSLSTSIHPWCSRTMSLAIERPSPVPFSVSLVVKNGSKRRARVALSIPHSVTWTQRYCPTLASGRL